MPRKPAHEQFDTLKVLQDQAFELFGRYGYEGVSIGDIAKQAKLSKGALYWHFSGKEALYLSCLKRLHGLFEHYIFTPMQAESNAVKGVLMVFNGLENLLQDPIVQKGIGGFWLIPSTPETAEIMATQRAFEVTCKRVLSETLQRGKEQGRIDLGDDREDMSRAMISIMEAIVLPLKYYGREESHRMLAVLAKTLLRAYASKDAMTG